MLYSVRFPVHPHWSALSPRAGSVTDEMLTSAWRHVDVSTDAGPTEFWLSARRWPDVGIIAQSGSTTETWPSRLLKCLADITLHYLMACAYPDDHHQPMRKQMYGVTFCQDLDRRRLVYDCRAAVRQLMGWASGLQVIIDCNSQMSHGWLLFELKMTLG